MTVKGHAASVRGRTFRARVRLRSGRNAIRVVARRRGYRSAKRTMVVYQAAAKRCDPNYAGACLDPNSPDYDCAGGSGDGPDYTGPVRVVGDDHFRLDADGDREACE